MTVRLNGSTSGYTEIDAPASAGNNTLLLPTGNGLAGNILGTDGAGNLSWVNGRMVLETAKASTSGTSVDFTGIPSWAKQVTVMFSGVSTNGTSIIIVQLGTSAGFVTSGYNCSAFTYNTTGGNGVAFSNVNGIRTRDSNAATNAWRGSFVFATLGSNSWTTSGSFETASGSGVGTASINCGLTLPGALDRVRITTVNGTDTFDAGSINILYEG